MAQREAAVREQPAAVAPHELVGVDAEQLLDRAALDRVRAGRGVTVMPRWTVARLARGLSLVRVGARGLWLDWALLTRNEPAAAPLRAFIDTRARAASGRDACGRRLISMCGRRPCYRAAMLVNAYCTHRAPPALAFPHELRSRRDRADAELDAHLRGFMGFVMGGGARPMSQTRYAVLRHLERVQHHLALEVAERDLEAFAAWAREANALLFLADATVRAPDGAVLVDPTTGEPAPGAAMPYPRDAVARKVATDRALAERGIRVPPTLPPVVGEVEVEVRLAAEVTARCAALFAVAVRAESLATGDPLPADEIRRRLPIAEPAMSPKERAFFADAAPPQQAIVDHAWRYEALTVLAWALGRLDALPHPDRICDVPLLARLVLDEGLGDAPRLRATAEILDALDLHFRLHWAVTEARAKQAAPPTGLEPGVIVERHHALNWLTRFEDAAWDEVTTPT